MPPRYAVLFKTHAWDEFIERQLSRLQTVCERGDIHVFMDQTKGFKPVRTRHPVMHASEKECEWLGLQLEPSGSLFWYCNDYPTYYFYERYPHYDYYVIIEYDVACCVSLDNLVSEAAARGIDAIAQPIKTVIAEWHWAKTGEGVYGPGQSLFASLFCFAVFSRAAVELLLRRRRALTADLAQGRITNWPYGELFMATELQADRRRVAPLADFASVTSYDWWPPTLDFNREVKQAGEIIHPFLDEPRYLASCFKFAADLTAFFDPASALVAQTSQCLRSLVLTALMSEVRKRKNVALLARVKYSLSNADRAVTDMPINVALGKPATQSSVSQWSRHQDVGTDAAGGVNGDITGSYGFHTGEDDRPWWMVDLAGRFSLSEFRIYNRLDVRHRARHLQIWLSETAVTWSPLLAADPPHDFGGADGQPLRLILPEPRIARFVRLELDGRDYLHLDEVEVFGEPV